MKTNTGERRHRASGFSLLEIMVVVALGITVTTIAVLSLVPVMNQQYVTNAYNTTMAAMRLGRDNAVSQRTSYSVTFSNGVSASTIVVAPTVTGFQGDLPSATYQLPPGVTFLAQTGIPNTSATTPDGYGIGAAAIDFGYSYPGTGAGGQTSVYFCPDGSSQNVTGAGTCAGMNNWSGGVVYLAQSGNLLSQRALTVWGGTGRIHGWRLYYNNGAYQWVRE